MDARLVRTLFAVALPALASGACSEPAGPDEGASPDLILFQISPLGGTGLGGDVYTVAPDGSNLVRRTTLGDVFAPAWSPDGTTIAFSRTGLDPNVFVMDADGTNLRRVTTGEEEKVQPAWAPDGRSLMYVQFSGAGYTGELSLRTVSVDEGTTTVVATCECQWPTWSPDGSKIVYVSWVPESDDRPGILVPSVFMMNADATGAHNLLAQGMWGHMPRWSPDGSRIVFAGHDGSGLAYDVYVIAADGTGLTRLTTLGQNGSPAFSSDGARIAFDHAVPGGGTVLHVMDADGSGLQQITDPLGIQRYATWRP
jgi:TolB protein